MKEGSFVSKAGVDLGGVGQPAAEVHKKPNDSRPHVGCPGSGKKEQVFVRITSNSFQCKDCGKIE